MSAGNLNTLLSPVAGAKREDAKRYLAEHKMPQIFESLLSCLMMERPENPVEYIEKKMKEIRTIGPDKIAWDTLVSHLHPYRDNVRRQFVRDGSLFDQEFAKLQGEIEEYNQRKKQHLESLADDYTPELFQLTEATSWQWLWTGEAFSNSRMKKKPLQMNCRQEPAPSQI